MCGIYLDGGRFYLDHRRKLTGTNGWRTENFELRETILLVVDDRLGGKSWGKIIPKAGSHLGRFQALSMRGFLVLQILPFFCAIY